MPAYLLKRALPFSLTLVIGAALGGLADNSFGTRGGWTRRAYSPGGHRIYRGAGGCSSFKRRRPADASTRAAILFQPLPRYTEEARRNRFTGSIRLRVRLDADGTVSDVAPLGFLPFGLTEAAEEAARQIKFRPATSGGVPVASWEEVRMEFVEARTVKTFTLGEGGVRSRGADFSRE